jgi:AraC family transcriptional regulator
MPDNQIVVAKNNQQEALGLSPAHDLHALAHWTGLKISHFHMPEQVVDRHVLGQHPVITLVKAGRTHSRLQYGAQDVSTQCEEGDLMCYRGGMEISRAQWRTHGAQLLSIELDPARMLACEDGDARLASPTLTGAPRFNDARLRALMLALWDEVVAGCPRGRLYTDSISLGLAGHVHARFGVLTEDRREARAQLTSAQLNRVNEYLRAHLGEPLGLHDLARVAGQSRFHFARLFRNTVGHSPHQHVLRERVQRAHSLLVGTSLPLSEIALRTGFSSQSHFSDTCRRLLGATPSSLRLQG